MSFIVIVFFSNAIDVSHDKPYEIHHHIRPYHPIVLCPLPNLQLPLATKEIPLGDEHQQIGHCVEQKPVEAQRAQHIAMHQRMSSTLKTTPWALKPCEQLHRTLRNPDALSGVDQREHCQNNYEQQAYGDFLHKWLLHESGESPGGAESEQHHRDDIDGHTNGADYESDETPFFRVVGSPVSGLVLTCIVERVHLRGIHDAHDAQGQAAAYGCKDCQNQVVVGLHWLLPIVSF